MNNVPLSPVSPSDTLCKPMKSFPQTQQITKDIILAHVYLHYLSAETLLAARYIMLFSVG